MTDLTHTINFYKKNYFKKYYEESITEANNYDQTPKSDFYIFDIIFLELYKNNPNISDLSLFTNSNYGLTSNDNLHELILDIHLIRKYINTQFINMISNLNDVTNRSDQLMYLKKLADILRYFPKFKNQIAKLKDDLDNRPRTIKTSKISFTNTDTNINFIVPRLLLTNINNLQTKQFNIVTSDLTITYTNNPSNYPFLAKLIEIMSDKIQIKNI